MSLDRDRFCKVLALAESDQDGEALAAVRKAVSMARAAGMSLGEAVSSGEPESSFDFGAFAQALKGEKENVRLKRLVAQLTEQLAAKVSRGAGYQEGRLEGYEEGRKGAIREFMGLDAFKEGYRSGFRAGEESERNATNRAYSRGYADGQASVSLKAAAKPRRQKAGAR
jgi:hypothetical protein